ncbi:MAG: TatD family nuclease-associated radical SAM protein [Eubacterium sp.]|nr:TatD family nuclease-associated radical SAM protein [Eubacterium sp.]
MILYTVTGKAGNEGYLDIANSQDLTGKNIYVNLTNRCPCNCVFCLRHTKELLEGNSLWLKDGEPEVEEVLDEFSEYDLNCINEIVFCGYGEPTERIDDMCEIIDKLKITYPEIKVRLNTIGLGNLIHNKDITPMFEGRIDTISISLNAPNEQEFLDITRSKFGIESYEALKEFAVLSNKYVPNVVLTVVEKVMSEEKIEECRKICDNLGVKLRIREFEEN